MPSTRPSDLLPDFSGKTVDRFRLLERLGKGSFGCVYSCVDTSLAKDSARYAIKCMLAPEPGSRDSESFERELDLHARVSSHPNIITLHDVVRAGPYVFMVLDLCDGGELFTAIEDGGFHQKDDLVMKIYLQLLDALKFCHDNDVYHRDLKPENILYSQSTGQVYLADFGLSTHERFSHSRGCGTSHYTSPECIGEDSPAKMYLNTANDMWALGVILINMLTMRRPWHKAVLRDPCYAAFVADPNWIYDALPVSWAVSEIVKGVFEVDPAKRLGLEELRGRVEGVETFFKPEVELGRQGGNGGGDPNKQAVANAAPGGRSPALRSARRRLGAIAGFGSPLVDVCLDVAPGVFVIGESTSSGGSASGNEPSSAASSSCALVTPPEHTVDPGNAVLAADMPSRALELNAPPDGVALRERQTMMDFIAERLKGLEVRSRAVGDVLDARIRKNRALLDRLGGRMGAS
ncbi:kinase-like protein [Schizophyllum commune Tattone D]|nr:kinase-like protein [Schizophyllum commune Tattone D]